MTNKKKKEKKTCTYELDDYKCDRPLYYKKLCIFHSGELKRKKITFMEAFWKEYKLQKKNDKFIFTGFVFPPGADLQRIRLYEADLRGAYLMGANLQGANLMNANLQRAYIHEADLREAQLQIAKLQGAILRLTNLYGANLGGTDLQGAMLEWANLKGTNLQNANLKGTNLSCSSFEKATVNGVKYDRSTIFRGIDVTQAKGNRRFVRFAKDQDFLEELRSTKRGERIYKAWKLFADCGRSIKRWALWSFGFSLYFALIWLLLGGDFFSFNPEKNITWFSYFYYSIVTFTTLGFGDIVPTHWLSEFYVAIEVILGYVMLGGLISIFANKLARRS